MTACPERMTLTSDSLGFATRRMASAWAYSSTLLTIVAPASANAWSGIAAPAPAPCSTRMSSPAASSLPRTSGTRATRRSPGAVSLATPIFIGNHLTWVAEPRTGRCSRRSRWVAGRIPARDRGCGGSDVAFGAASRPVWAGRSPWELQPGRTMLRRCDRSAGSASWCRSSRLRSSNSSVTGCSTPSCHFPLDTIVVVVVVAMLAWGFSTIAFRRIEQLSAALRARNVDLERRAASARALHRVSVAIAALAESTRSCGRSSTRRERCWTSMSRSS